MFLGAPKFIVFPKDSTCVKDNLAKFECIIDSLPKAKITWFLNDKELTIKDNVKFEVDAKTNSNSLIIPKVTSSHTGFIRIKAVNSVGEIEEKFKLDVFG